MKSTDGVWTIGDLAARFELPTHVLRHWEDVGLLNPERDAAGRRRFDERDAVRVAAILVNKAAGMTLEQIGVLLDADAPQRHVVLQAHLDELAERMREMERSAHLTRHAMECRAHDVANCPHFRQRVADVVDGRTRVFRMAVR